MEQKELKPKLRFKEFNTEFRPSTVGNVAIIVDSLHTTPKNYEVNGFPMIRVTDINNQQLDLNNCLKVSEEVFKEFTIRYKPQINDIVISRVGTCGASIRLESNKDVCLGQNTVLLRPNENSIYLINLIRSEVVQRQVRKKIVGSTQKTLSINDLKKFKLRIPYVEEQQKIASFLSAVDSYIENLKQQEEALEKYKKGMMQKIFSQQIRFKDENGKEFPVWEEKSLNEVLTERLERNKSNEYSEVFSVAKSKGVINQIEHLGRSYSSLDTSNYKVLFPNDIIYTKSPTSDFPYGIIKQNQTNRIGLVSTLYAVYKPINKNIGYILHTYFLSWENTYNYLNPLVQKGAKNTINISNKDFINGAKLHIPISEVEQIKIVEFLSKLDEVISVEDIRIVQVEQWKKGLLQQLFI